MRIRLGSISKAYSNPPTVCGICSAPCWTSSAWITVRNSPDFTLAGVQQSRISLNGVHARCHEQRTVTDREEHKRCCCFDRQGANNSNREQSAVKRYQVHGKGGVSLATDYTDGVLTITVEDTGTGMTEEEQQRVFGAFERLSNAAAKDGFGLGLAIVHNIVMMLHGKYGWKAKRERQLFHGGNTYEESRRTAGASDTNFYSPKWKKPQYRSH